MHNKSDADRLIKYLEEALENKLKVASFERCKDSQCSWVLKKINEKGQKRKIKLLDYGCGNLRLMNALSKSSLSDKVEYHAADVTKPYFSKDVSNFFLIKELRSLEIKTYDLIVVMNVIHELSVLEFCDLIENCRRLLNKNGSLLIIDMAILPEGESGSTPFYPWELKTLFFEVSDESYALHSGIPVVAMEIFKKNIPIFSQFNGYLQLLMESKENTHCHLASMLPEKNQNIHLQKIIQDKFFLNRNNVYNLGYLMLLSGFVKAKREAYDQERKNNPTYDEVAEAAESILKFFFEYYSKNNELPNYFTVFDSLGAKHSYISISDAMAYMSNPIPAFFFCVFSGNNWGLNEIEPTEDLDIFEDRYDYSDIKKMGLGPLISLCHSINYPEG